jgi:hypothetical protein
MGRSSLPARTVERGASPEEQEGISANAMPAQRICQRHVQCSNGSPVRLTWVVPISSGPQDPRPAHGAGVVCLIERQQPWETVPKKKTAHTEVTRENGREGGAESGLLTFPEVPHKVCKYKRKCAGWATLIEGKSERGMMSQLKTHTPDPTQTPPTIATTSKPNGHPQVGVTPRQVVNPIVSSTILKAIILARTGHDSSRCFPGTVDLARREKRRDLAQPREVTLLLVGISSASA